MAIRPGSDQHGESGLWYEKPVGEWVAAWRLLPQGGRLVFGELRVFPNERRRAAGEWSGDPAKVPGRGITVDELRRLVSDVGEHRRQAQAELAGKLRRRFPDLNPFGPEGLFGRHGITEAAVRPSPERKRLRRGSRDDLYHAEIAAVYAGAVAAGNTRPVSTIAQATGLSPNTVKDVVREARRRGLLTEAERGRAAGRLTPSAKRLLRQRDKKEG